MKKQTTSDAMRVCLAVRGLNQTDFAGKMRKPVQYINNRMRNAVKWTDEDLRLAGRVLRLDDTELASLIR